jgi:hypothetical protein
MQKPIHWKTFPHNLLMIQIGFLLYGVSLALAIRTNLGTDTWATLYVALSKITSRNWNSDLRIIGWHGHAMGFQDASCTITSQSRKQTNPIRKCGRLDYQNRYLWFTLNGI